MNDLTPDLPSSDSTSVDILTHFTVYGGPTNRGGRALWALEELGLTYEIKNLALFKGQQRSPDYLALNPQGKVPTMVISSPDPDAQRNPEVITESLAILYVLAQRYGQGHLWPLDLHDQARCHQWLAFGVTELEPPIWIHAKHTFIYPEKRRIPEIFPSCTYDYKRALHHIENTLSDGRQWLCGAQFYIADLLIAHTLMWGEQRQISVLPKHTHDYLNRAMARPAYQRVHQAESSPTP